MPPTLASPEAVAETPEEFYERAKHALLLPPLDEWETFPFDGAMRPRELRPPAAGGTPRGAAAGGRREAAARRRRRRRRVTARAGSTAAPVARPRTTGS